MWATVEGVAPDGCTLDAEGHIWAADALGNRLVRVAQGKGVVDEILGPDGLGVYACMLGGDGRPHAPGLRAPTTSSSTAPTRARPCSSPPPSTSPTPACRNPELAADRVAGVARRRTFRRRNHARRPPLTSGTASPTLTRAPGRHGRVRHRSTGGRAPPQHALIAAAQFAALGGTAAMARHRLRTGRWARAAEGVFRLAGAPVTWHSQVLAAVLAGGDGAVASHRTAGALHQLDGCRQGVPEVTVPGDGGTGPGVRTHESTDLHLATMVRIDGIPTTTVPRTLLDLGAVVPRRRVHLAVDNARRRSLTDWGQLLDVLVTHARRGRRGVGALRAILDEHYDELAVTDSAPERLLVTLLVQGGLPRPELQHAVVVDGRSYRLDLAYPPERGDRIRRATPRGAGGVGVGPSPTERRGALGMDGPALHAAPARARTDRARGPPRWPRWGGAAGAWDVPATEHAADPVRE